MLPARPILAFGLSVSLALACGGGRTEAPPSSYTTPADAGDCVDRARVAPLCRRTMEDRCRAQIRDCDARCRFQFGSLPGNDEKEPTIRGDMETSSCTSQCGGSFPGCMRQLASQCPEPCPAPDPTPSGPP